MRQHVDEKAYDSANPKASMKVWNRVWESAVPASNVRYKPDEPARTGQVRAPPYADADQ